MELPREYHSLQELEGPPQVVVTSSQLEERAPRADDVINAPVYHSISPPGAVGPSNMTPQVQVC